MSLSLFAPVLLALFLIAIQGVLLQTACTIAGERKPDYGHALTTAVLAGLVATVITFVFGWTAGVFIGFFSKTLAWFLTAFLGLSVTASLYHVRLNMTAPQAFLVAIVHAVMGSLLSAALWGLLHAAS